MRLGAPCAIFIFAAASAFGCHGASPAAPSSVSTPAPVTPPPAPNPSRGPLPLGQASGGPTACPGGSPPGPTCLSLSVSCPDVAATALVRVERPSVSPRGTILLVTDGDGSLFYRARPVSVFAAGLIATFVADGLTAVEVAWRPGIWGSPRARTIGCVFATAAQGAGTGASQIAFGLSHYGMGEYLDLANLGGGPSGCPLCLVDPLVAPEPLLPGPAPASNREPVLSYPATVNVLLGSQEPSAAVRAEANAFYTSVTSAKALTIVPGTSHEIEQTEAGVAALAAAVRAALR
jgi:hypothetical protein